MSRTVTAIYRSDATAELVRRGLAELGIARERIRKVPATAEPIGPLGMRADPRHLAALHALGLPAADLRAYRSAVQRGDYVVSVEVGRDRVAQALEVMRLPKGEALEPNPGTADQVGGWAAARPFATSRGDAAGLRASNCVDINAYRRARRAGERRHGT